jgi:hypothetical protein
MCFSATASFTTSALLLLSGSYAISKALKNDNRYLLLACIPLIFALQQAFEGIVWLNIHNDLWKMTYLFFAYLFWPPYIPISLLAIEKNPKKKKILWGLALSGCIVGLGLYVPVILNHNILSIFPLEHSICYYYNVQDERLYTLSLLYVIGMSLACFVSSEKAMRIFAILLMISYGVTFLFFKYAFTSVWCFFGAIISFFIIQIIPNLKAKVAL